MNQYVIQRVSITITYNIMRTISHLQPLLQSLLLLLLLLLLLNQHFLLFLHLLNSYG